MTFSLLTGCGVAPTPVSPVAGPGGLSSLGHLTGKVHGGQQPLVGARVYVYAVGTGGYGTGSVSLLTAGLGTMADGNGHYYTMTDASGSFGITGDYLCVAGTQVYVYVSGGDPGAGSGVNSAIGLLAGLGECPAEKTLALAVPYVTVNEVSTVVAAYALAGFATDATHISSSGTALAATGVKNAMATALNIVDVATGTVPSVSRAGNAVLPVANIYTLANILASCVNSAGPGSGNCGTLFGDTGTSTGTAAAAIAMAHAPFTNVGGLFGLASSSGPFQPGLGTVPADLTVSLQYLTPLYAQNLSASDATYANVVSIAFDSGGNVWTYSDTFFSNPPDMTTTLVKYSSTGSVLATTILPVKKGKVGGYPYEAGSQLSIDFADNVWAGAGDGLYELSKDGTLLSPAAGYQCPGLGDVISPAFGASTVYVGEPSSNGTIPMLSLTGDCQGVLTAAANVQIFGPLTVDPLDNVYAAGYVGEVSSVYKFAAGLSSSFPARAEWVTSDDDGNIWTYIVGSYTDASAVRHVGEALGKYSPGGEPFSPQDGYAGGGLLALPSGAALEDLVGPSVVALDGAGAVWLESVAGEFNGGLTVPIVGLKNDGTPITPAGGLVSNYSDYFVYSVAPDGSGNLWANPQDGSLVEFVGLTTPVATPILYNQLGQRP